MTTKHSTKTLKDGFVTGFKGVFLISGFLSKPLEPLTFKLALLLSTIFVITIFWLDVSIYEAILIIKDSCINLLPGILGFTIGGYSFLIGFIQPDLMNKISEPRGDTVFSLFQKASASFACNILIQAIALIIAYIIHFIIFIDSLAKKDFDIPIWMITFMNSAGLIIVTISFSLSLAVILQLVLNVFNFSQLHHYFINKQKLENKDGDYS